MKVKTSELQGAALDWAVAQCEGVETKKYKDSPSLFFGIGFDKWRPSTDWAQGGPIIELHKIEITAWGKDQWRARSNWNEGYKDWVHVTMFEVYGPTPLIAAMRCYVASKLGNEVEVPEELV